MEPAITESKELNQAHKNTTTMLVSENDDTVTVTAGNDRSSLIVKVKQT